VIRHLYIKNYALIDELDIDFMSGFSVITGETGAGKSIILGALGLILGQRADTKAIKTDAAKCIIEASFNISDYGLQSWFDDNDVEYDEGECIIRRELTSTGKSRGFINDTPTTLQQMRELGEKLIDIHSQHQNLLLNTDDFQLSVVDIIAHNEKEREEYSKAYGAWNTATKELQALEEQINKTRENEELMRFQLQDLTAAGLQEGEQEELEQERDASQHVEDIKSALYEVDSILNDDERGAVSALRQCYNRISGITSIYPKVEELAERINSLHIELKDISDEVSNELEHVDFDPERLAFITERLDNIYTLLKKYHKADIAELLEEQQALQQAVDNIDNSDEKLSNKKKEVAELLEVLKQKADKLSATRKKSTAVIKKDIESRLTLLGMNEVSFQIEILPTELSARGQEKMAFLFSANKGMPMRPVSQVASGGEIARLMLSIKAMISGAVKMPTIIFDEIDTGVSGKMAERMADVMREMGDNKRQVISITHLPQIAARGEHHYIVEKSDNGAVTSSRMRLLTPEERIDEISQMLSGSDITDAARENARQLLKNNK
jgi:DNA repair protein RecN (Recombination protein N)